jgi:hypothetical protein
MRKLLSFALITFTLLLFYNNAANWHFHKLSNGIVIEHAHPYSKLPSPENSPFEKHQHSDSQYLLLDLIYNSWLIIVLIYSGSLLVLVQNRIIRVLQPLPVYNNLIASLPFLRAPPSN